MQTCAESAPERASVRMGALRFVRDCPGCPRKPSHLCETVPAARLGAPERRNPYPLACPPHLPTCRPVLAYRLPAVRHSPDARL